MRVLFIHEFGPGADESMMQDLISALERRIPQLRWKYFNGFLKRYGGAGTSPKRLLNLAYMFFFLPVIILFFRPTHILARSAPPGMQIWSVLLGAVFRVPVIAWLMDYHPEMEARILARRNFPRIASLLRALDRYFLRRFEAIVVLDSAMRDLLRERAGNVPVLVHPTWNKGFVYEGRGSENSKTRQVTELKLAYAGNLGNSHPLETFNTLVKCLQPGISVSLVAIGASEPGEKRLESFARELSLPLEILPRTPFHRLRDVFDRHEVDLGVVLLSDEFAGCLSPSKFSAYLAFGIPILYIGPRGTNTDLICSRFAAGFSLRNNPAELELTTIAGRLLNRSEIASAAAHVEGAAHFFTGQNEHSLAELLIPFLTRPTAKQSIDPGREPELEAHPR